MVKHSDYIIDGREPRSCTSPTTLIQILKQAEFLILPLPLIVLLYLIFPKDSKYYLKKCIKQILYIKFFTTFFLNMLAKINYQ